MSDPPNQDPIGHGPSPTPPPNNQMAKPKKPPRTPHETLLLARKHTLRTALLLAVLAPLIVAGAVIAVRTGRLSYRVGYEALIMGWPPTLATLAFILGVLGLIAVPLIKPRKGARMALAAIAISAVTLLAFVQYGIGAVRNPPIHDVATDWRDPLTFSADMLKARGETANPLELAPVVPEGPNNHAFLGQPVAGINARTCPAATPAVLQSDVPFAYHRAQIAVSNFGWTVVTDDRAGG
ncbi:MAG: hypothetical protein ABIO39_03415, partial [Caulobacteraceae bacterium]